MMEYEKELKGDPELSVHTADIGTGTYDIIRLRSTMEKIPEKEVEISTLTHTVGRNHRYWDDENGNPLGPFEFLEDWQAAKKKPEWKKHVDSIENAELDKYPIWICNVPDSRNPSKRSDVVIDGMHRLTKAVLEGRKKLKAKYIRYEEIPEDCKVK